MESLHPYDTQMNECLNNIIARYAPKNKHYSASSSLVMRIAHAICITNEGLLTYLTTIFNNLGINMNYDLLQSLTTMSRVRELNKHRKKLQSTKRRQKHGQDVKQRSQVIDEGLLTYGKCIRFK